MLLGKRSKMQNKEASIWGVGLNQSLGVEGVDNLPDYADEESMQFVFDLNTPFGYLLTDVKGAAPANNAALVGVGSIDYGIVGTSGAGLGADVIIATGPTAQEGIKNFRVQQASLQLNLNAAGVALLAGVKIRFQWAEYGAGGTAPAATLATQDVTSPGLKTFSNLQQLLGYAPFITYPNTLVCTLNLPDGGVTFPAASTVRREARVILRPLKLRLPV